MPAQIQDFNTRSELGMRNPRSVSYNIDPSNGGAAAHWGGPRQNLIPNDHSRCVKIWLGWQRYHMDNHGWVDLAYTGGYCNCGIALAGRGHGVRTAANGTNAGNGSYHAYVWIGGQGERPNKRAFDALDWWVLEGRKHGAGQAVRPHRYFTGTGCPGFDIINYVPTIHNKAIKTVTSPEPVTDVTDFDKWWASMDKNKQEILEALAERIEQRGGSNPGRSLANAVYMYNDNSKEHVDELVRLVGAKSPGGALNTSLQGVMVGGLNAFLYLNDQHNAKLVTTKRYDAK